MRAVLAAAALVFVLAVTGGAGAQSPTLVGTVGPGFSIRLADASGNPVTRLDPGTYTIEIEDKSDIHNFHLTGPGVDQATDIEQVGTVKWTVTFVAGRYHYQCDPHASTMKGDFTVGPGSAPPTTTAPTTTTPGQKLYSIAGAVRADGTVALTRLGRRVVTVPAGPVSVVVTDRSGKGNFHLSGPGVNRATSRPGKPTVTWRLTLKRGLYTYRSDAAPLKRGTFRAV